MKNILKKVIIAIVSIIMVTGSVYTIKASTPIISIGVATPKTIYVGESVTYKVVADPEETENFNITASDITLNGFTAEKSVVKTGTYSASVTFSNIQGTVGSGKRFTVGAGVAVSATGDESLSLQSPSFTLQAKVQAKIVPIISIGVANPKTIYVGESVTYKVVADPEDTKTFNITASDITLNGFTANISINKIGEKSASVTFSNIQGTVGSGKRFTVKAGVAVSETGDGSLSLQSPSFTLQAKVQAKIVPVISISVASPKTIYVGESVTYKVVADPEDTKTFNITASDITLNGFTANISINKTGEKSATVTFTNVQGTVGSGKTFTVGAGVAVSETGDGSLGLQSPSFSIKAKAVIEEPVKDPVKEPVKDPVKDPAIIDEKDDTPKTGVVDYSLMAGLISTLSLAGIVVTKKYFK